jgi:hypothetical protein
VSMQPITFKVKDEATALALLGPAIQQIRTLAPHFASTTVTYKEHDGTDSKSSIIVTIPLFQKNDKSDALASKRALLILLETLTRINQAYLANHPDSLPLYQSGIVYQPEFGTEEWQDIPTTFERGFGDCEDLAAHISAEFRMKGINSQPYLRMQMHNNSFRIHALAQMPTGEIEDPSLKLGMTKWNDYLANS